METIKIKDLGRVVTGGTPPTRNRSYYGSSMPLIKPTDMELDGRYIGETEESLSEAGIEKFKTRTVPAMTPCIVTIGTIGKSCLTKEDSLCNQAVNCVVVDTSKFNTMYAYYLLKKTIPQVKALSSGTASGRENVSKSVFENISINVHTRKSQDTIALILSAYDDLIENNLKRIKILEEMAQMIYREWFVNFRFPNHESVKMVDSPLGKIPEGWAVINLGDIVNEIIDYRGKTPKKLGGDWVEEGIIALSALNIKGGRIVSLEKSKHVSEELYNKWMKIPLEAGDILMTSEAPLGELHYLPNIKKYCLSQRLYSIRANPNIIKPSILYYLLASPEVQKQIHSRATGTTVLGIRQKLLREVPITVPPIDMQGKASEALDEYLVLMELLTNKNDNLRKTRDMLLPKLISGELDVENLDIRVPEEAA